MPRTLKLTHDYAGALKVGEKDGGKSAMKAQIVKVIRDTFGAFYYVLRVG